MRDVRRWGWAWLSLRRVAAALGVAVLASSCVYELRDEGITVVCAPLRYEVNVNEVTLSAAQLDAIDAAIAEFGALVGRPAEGLGATDDEVAGHTSSDPILIELAWPNDAPAELGFAAPYVIADEYRGGWVMLNPLVRHLPTGVLRRLILHELGHLHGLGDVTAADELMNPALTVDDWGTGDLTGLFLTHQGGCPGATLAAELYASIG